MKFKNHPFRFTFLFLMLKIGTATYNIILYDQREALEYYLKYNKAQLSGVKLER
jgi:hypothetical protein